jgi:hypothetical protein
MNMSYILNVDCWLLGCTILRHAFALTFEVSTPPPPPPRHVPVALPCEICTICFEGRVSNILQDVKMLHFYFF